MHHAGTGKAKSAERRSPKPSLSPYLLEEVGLTLLECEANARSMRPEPRPVRVISLRPVGPRDYFIGCSKCSTVASGPG